MCESAPLPVTAVRDVPVDPRAVRQVDLLAARILALPQGPPVPWFLDVDGVLNIEVQGRPREWPTYRCAPVQTSRQLDVPFVWSPELVDCINLLVHRGQVQVRWLTSWKLDAPLCAAPAIGLIAGRRIAEEGQPEETLWWKLAVIQRFATAGDFAVWTDDYIDEEVGTDTVEMITDGKVLALCPNATQGLTPQHLHLIIDAIAARRR